MGRSDSESREASPSRKARARSRSRDGGGKRSRSRDRKKKRSRSKERTARKERSREKSASRERGRRARSKSKSKSRKARRRSKSPERIPPTDFQDYEPAENGGGWYVYKRTGKWKYHPETGLYLHVKSKVYYVQKDGDLKAFRKIEDDDDHIIKKMKQSEEMRKAIQSTEFVKFDESGNAAEGEEEAAAAPPGDDAQAKPPGPEPKPPEPVKEEEPKSEGRVQKWDSEKGFGFVVPLGKENSEEKGLFVHRKHVVGSTATNPINLKETVKVLYKPGVQEDGRPCALEVVMLGVDGKPLPIHAGAMNLEEKKKSYYVTAEALGLRVHTESWPGLKKTLQDRYVSDEAMEELGVYFAVFDGHGGSQVADSVAKQLHKTIMQQFRQRQVQPASRDEKVRAAIREAFLNLDKEILSMAERKKYETVGSTALMALLHGNPKLGTALRLVVANCGDSRAVLCRAGQAVAASEDHKPTRLDEKKRIERAGGLVMQVRGAWRVLASSNPNSNQKSKRKEYQGLAMTRSFGDIHFKRPSALSSVDPEIQVIPLTDKDLFMVLATDGVYDVLSNQEIVDLGMRHWNNPEEASTAIVRAAYQKGSEDNLTALVIQFGWADKNIEKYKDKRSRPAVHVDTGSKKPNMLAAASSKPVDDDMDMFG